GQADKAKITTEMAAHHGVQPVNVFRSVLGTPFHAKDVALRYCGSCGGHAEVKSGYLVAFFCRLRATLLGTLDQAALGQTLVTQHTDLLDLRLAAGSAELKQLDVTRTGHAVIVKSLFLFRDWAP